MSFKLEKVLAYLFITMFSITWACTGNDKTSTTTTGTDTMTLVKNDSIADKNNNAMSGNKSNAEDAA